MIPSLHRLQRNLRISRLRFFLLEPLLRPPTANKALWRSFHAVDNPNFLDTRMCHCNKTLMNCFWSIFLLVRRHPVKDGGEMFSLIDFRRVLLEIWFQRSRAIVLEDFRTTFVGQTLGRVVVESGDVFGKHESWIFRWVGQATVKQAVGACTWRDTEHGRGR